MYLNVSNFGNKFLINFNGNYTLSKGTTKEEVKNNILKNYNKILLGLKEEKKAIEKMIRIIGFSQNKNFDNYTFNLKKENNNYKITLPDNREFVLEMFSDKDNILMEYSKDKQYFSILLDNKHECNCFVDKNNIEKEVEEMVVKIIEHNYLFKEKAPIFLFDSGKLRESINYLPLLYLVSLIDS